MEVISRIVNVFSYPVHPVNISRDTRLQELSRVFPRSDRRMIQALCCIKSSMLVDKGTEQPKDHTKILFKSDSKHVVEAKCFTEDDYPSER